MALPTFFRRGINLVRRLFHKPAKPVDVQCSNSTLPGPDVTSHDSKLPTPSTASYHRPTNQQEDPTILVDVQCSDSTLPCPNVISHDNKLPRSSPTSYHKPTSRQDPTHLTTDQTNQQDPASLLVDGYISHSFGPQSAERYFSNILKSKDVSASYRFGPDGGSFVASSPIQYSWVLDRRVLSIGTVVPQILWTPHTVTDRRQHVQDADLQMPIFFIHTDGRLGLTLEAAISGRCHTLLNSQFSAPLGPQTTTHIRIGWHGYREFRRQVQIRDETPNRNTVTLSKFAQHVGRSVDAFLKTAQVDSENQVPQWRLGERGVQPHEIIIIGAIQVSSGGWMPILQLTRYIF